MCDVYVVEMLIRSGTGSSSCRLDRSFGLDLTKLPEVLRVRAELPFCFLTSLSLHYLNVLAQSLGSRNNFGLDAVCRGRAGATGLRSACVFKPDELKNPNL